jgi:hypothetical protein
MAGLIASVEQSTPSDISPATVQETAICDIDSDDLPALVAVHIDHPPPLTLVRPSISSLPDKCIPQDLWIDDQSERNADDVKKLNEMYHEKTIRLFTKVYIDLDNGKNDFPSCEKLKAEQERELTDLKVFVSRSVESEC